MNPKNGFPLWVQDPSGLTLELCLDSARCFFDPVDPENDYSVQVGFGPEAFWWVSEAQLKGRNFSALVVMAVEAAWLSEEPKPGEQFPFTRLRFRLEVPKLGRYTVIHPFGETVFVVDTLDDKGKPERVFESSDIQFSAAQQHQGKIGPFLTWDTGRPSGFIGDPSIPHRVTGSPCGTNFFKVTAVDFSGKPIDLTGIGQNWMQTNLFTVMGKIATRAGVGVTRASYTRGAWDPGIEVFAFSNPAAVQAISVNVPGQSVTFMNGDAVTGRYFAFEEGDVAPTSITVTNTSDPAELNPLYPESSVTVPLVDAVVLKKAYYYRDTGILEIVAASTDEVSACNPEAAKLTAYTDDGRKLGDLATPVTEGVMLALPSLAVPPARVTVKSCFGGEATADVDIGRCERAGNSQNCRPE
ncbi:MAG: hypothetical protein HYY20_10440 [Candidatus Tectomicrobia bacterium]|uniref:Uncharacterized protein n=1 Tax=Tectimicrobiota bacterium TaxID=2528274 RepID=A0A932FZA8_UNCTE|nr:hypothetical protein [Candidatus Tectomicrobia bacterium]